MILGFCSILFNSLFANPALHLIQSRMYFCDNARVLFYLWALNRLMMRGLLFLSLIFYLNIFSERIDRAKVHYWLEQKTYKPKI